jgi:hypothetical protein
LKRFLLGVALAPTAAVSLYAAGAAALPVFAPSRQSLPFLLGFAGYPLLYFLAFRPLRLYIFGHELSHALAAALSGSRVRRFVAGRSSGHVVVSRSNTFIALAPYFVPIYSLLVLVAFRLASLWANGPWLYPVFLSAMGFTIAFHLVQTLDILLAERQKDLIQAGGVLFSMTCIALANAAVLVLLFKALFPHAVSLSGFGVTTARATAAFWREAGRAAAALIQTAYEFLSNRSPARVGA